MSVRLTKKSFVSAPTRSVNTPCLRAAVVGAEHPHAADQHGHLGRGQAHQLGAVEQQFLGADDIVLLQPVAEAVGQRLQHAKESASVCALGGIAAARRERHATSKPAALAACSTPTLPASTITSATLAPVRRDRLQHRQHPGQAGGLVALPVLLRGQADARAVGAAAHVRAAEGAGAVPGGGDHVATTGR
jgi:hypothetical protein